MTSRADRRPGSASAAKRRPAGSRKSGRGGTLLGLFLGVVLGLALAAGVAFYLMKAGNPYQVAPAGRETPRDATKETARPGHAEPGATEKPRFDFYRILPGAEEPRVQPKAGERTGADKATVERAVTPEKPESRASTKTDAKPGATPDKPKVAAERFWLQAGSFASQTDAEDLKARLAFAGWEATIQSVTLPDRGVRYRVRLGPYDNTEALRRMKGELAARGFDAAVIKN